MSAPGDGVAFVEFWHVPRPRGPHIVARESWDVTTDPPQRHVYEVRELRPEDTTTVEKRDDHG
jgi:hypothetical protein